MLFSVSMIDHVLHFDFQSENVPALSIVKYLRENNSTSFSLVKEEEPGMYSLENDQRLPIRWLYMLDDFCFEQQGILTEKEDPLAHVDDWNHLLSQLPTATFQQILSKSSSLSSWMFFRVINPAKYARDREGISRESMKNPDLWYTGDLLLSDKAKAVFEECAKFRSLEFSKYDSFAAAEGGIQIPSHRFYEEWSDFRYSVPPRRFLENDVRGRDAYSISPGVTAEELTVMMEAFRKCGVGVVNRTIGGYWCR